MRADRAARYVDEKSVEAFRRAVGTLYPRPRKVVGKGDRWLKDDLDRVSIVSPARPPRAFGISQRAMRVAKPAGWPRYMREKILADGKPAYFWAPHERDIKRGFTITSEALGQEYGAARERAAELNRHLDAWRAGRGEERSLDLHPGVGTVEWLVERYKRDGMEKVSPRSRPEYERAFNLVLRHKTKIGTEVGAAPIKAMTTLGVEKIYKPLLEGARVKKRLRQANVCMIRMARAWDWVFKRYPNMFPVPAVNPFGRLN